MSFSSFKGVSPAACTSPTSGSEILPSERTGIEREMSGSFQTLMASTSSLPITKLLSCGLSAAVAEPCIEADTGAFWAQTELTRTAPIISTASLQTFLVIADSFATPSRAFFKSREFSVSVALPRFVAGEFTGGQRRQIQIRLRSPHFVLLDFVQQCAVTYFQQARRSFAVPTRPHQCSPDGAALGFHLDPLDQGFQRLHRGRGWFRDDFLLWNLVNFQRARGGLVIDPAVRIRTDLTEDCILVARHQIALHQRFQFFQISRPGMVLARGHHNG